MSEGALKSEILILAKRNLKLKAKISELESRVNELDNIVESLDAKNKELESENTHHKVVFGENRKRIIELESDLREYKKLYELSKSPAEYEKLEKENRRLKLLIENFNALDELGEKGDLRKSNDVLRKENIELKEFKKRIESINLYHNPNFVMLDLKKVLGVD